jgi:putative tricarboxylic transport membrane protein
MLSNLWLGLSSLGSVEAVAFLFVGALIGVFVGVIPGLSGAVVMSIMLAFVYQVNLIGTLCLFIGVLSGSYYSASVTSILLNTPAHAEAFAVTFDGNPMARRGEAARALGISAASTCLGGLVGCLVLVAFIPIMNYLPQIFHPPQYLALVTIAMLLVGTLGTDSVAKAVASMGLGLAISSMGPSPISGVVRFSFGTVGFLDGVSLVALALGVFAIPQMVMVFGTKTSVAKQDMTGRVVSDTSVVELRGGSWRQLIGGVLESFRHWFHLLLAGLVGSLAGMVPGIGGFTANFLSYGVARQVSRKQDQWGTGIPEGIIAPEGASLAKEAGHMIPLLGLSIPGGVGGALFLGALTIKGIKTGFGFTESYPVLPYQVVWILALTGLIGTAAGVLAGPGLAKVTKIPGPVLVPFLFALSVLGPFLATVSFFAVVEVLAFGVLGLVLRRLRFSLATLLLGLVLGPTFESNVYLIHNIYPGLSFISAQPIADVMFAIAILILVVKTLEIRRSRRKVRLTREERVAHVTDPRLRAELIREQKREDSPYPLLSLITTVVLLAAGLFWTVYGITNYDLATNLFPTIGGILLALPMLFLLPFDIRNLVATRKAGRAAAAGEPDAAAGESPDGSSPVGEHLATDVPVTTPPGSPARTLESGDLVIGVREAVATPLADVLNVKVSDAAASDVKEGSWGRNGQHRRELIAFAWLTGLIVASYLLGFIVAIPAFVVLYGLFSTSDYFRTWRSRVIFAALSGAAMGLVTYESINLLHLVFRPVLAL